MARILGLFRGPVMSSRAGALLATLALNAAPAPALAAGIADLTNRDSGRRTQDAVAGLRAALNKATQYFRQKTSARWRRCSCPSCRRPWHG